MKSIVHSLAGLAAIAVLSNCASTRVQTQESQSATTPRQALQSLLDGNERFASGQSTRRDLAAQVKQTSKGQHPVAAVLGCMDSRAPHELIFDQGIGDIFSVRVAGNVASDDMLASLEYATAKVGAKAVLVLGHTRCGAVTGACHDAKLGHVTGLLAKIKPAVSQVAAKESRDSAAFEEKVVAENVRQVVSQLRAQSPILRKLEAEGKILIQGGVYHVETGRVEILN